MDPIKNVTLAPNSYKYWCQSACDSTFLLVFHPIRSYCGLWLMISHSGGVCWKTDRPVRRTSTWQHNVHRKQTSMIPVGFEHAISKHELPRTLLLDCAAAVI